MHTEPTTTPPDGSPPDDEKVDSVAGEEDPGAAVDAPVKDGHRPGETAAPDEDAPRKA